MIERWRTATRSSGTRTSCSRSSGGPSSRPPGLQVIGAPEVTTLVCGVSSSRALFEAAVDSGSGDGARPPRALLAQRAARRRRAAPRAGSRRCSSGNASLRRLPPRTRRAPRAREQRTAGGAPRRCPSPAPSAASGLAARCRPQSIAALAATVEQVTERPPFVIPGGPAEIRRVAVATGAAGYDLIRAAHEGFDALVTGEPEEPSQHAAPSSGST